MDADFEDEPAVSKTKARRDKKKGKKGKGKEEAADEEAVEASPSPRRLQGQGCDDTAASWTTRTRWAESRRGSSTPSLHRSRTA
jgi:hypothetical protein